MINNEKKLADVQDDFECEKIIKSQIDFYSTMCISRNFTWKKYLEKIFKNVAILNFLFQSKLEGLLFLFKFNH